MFRRYGTVDRADMRAALERTEQHERDGQHGHNLGHNGPTGAETQIGGDQVSSVN
jgi:hypothetical protein